jgi:hypothetical protein
MIEQGKCLINGPDSASLKIVLSHGAGVAMDSFFMERIARGLGDNGFYVVRFEFPYMRKMRQTGKRLPPDRTQVLTGSLMETLEEIGEFQNLVIGGKSLGGRIASMIADSLGVHALICLGYPFHPPGRPERLRTSHLENLKSPALICQGEMDPFGKAEEISKYPLSPSVRVRFLKDGDHSFKPGTGSSRTYEQNLDLAVDYITEFLTRAHPSSPANGMRRGPVPES